jgi:CMP-N-acetylneuraminic acid synthetase
MHIVGSIIARLGSKRLPYKNLLPFKGKPLIIHGIEILMQSTRVNTIVVSTESALIAAQVAHIPGVHLLKRPDELAGDKVPSIPVFQHICTHFPCDLHVNFNINFPLCEPAVIDRAIEVALSDPKGESLSVPFAVWAQTRACLFNYGDFWNITAPQFEDERAGMIDVHTEEDLLEVHRIANALPNPFVE